MFVLNSSSPRRTVITNDHDPRELSTCFVETTVGPSRKAHLGSALLLPLFFCLRSRNSTPRLWDAFCMLIPGRCATSTLRTKGVRFMNKVLINRFRTEWSVDRLSIAHDGGAKFAAIAAADPARFLRGVDIDLSHDRHLDHRTVAASRCRSSCRSAATSNLT